MPKAEKKMSEENISETEANPLNQPAAQPTDGEIAVRAYHIYLERGSIEGNPDDDWLQAKYELAKGSD